MLTRFLTFLIVLSVIIIPGCAEPHRPAASNEVSAAAAISQPADPLTIAPQESTEPEGQITLRDAIAYALVNSPQLRAFSWDIHTAEANEMQAALLPNPQLQVQVEEFGGTGERRGFNSSESTIQVGQFIELARKRSKRIHLATLEKQLAHWDYRAKRLDVISNVGAAFLDVLAAQEKLALSREMVGLTEQTHSAVAQRVSAGKDSPLKETKAKVALSTMQIQSQRASQSLKSARIRLAAIWGASTAAFDGVTGQFYEVPPVPEPNDLMSRVRQNPDIARWAIERQKYRAAFDLEKAKATSDMTIKGGLKQLSEGDDTAFIVGLSIPIPMFDRNQAGIRRATYAIEKAAEQQRTAEIHIESALSQGAQSLATAFAEATVLAKDVVPGAQSAFDAATLGYKAGKFDYLDVLDAQRTLFDAKGQYILSLAEYHKTKVLVERLIAQSLDSIDDTQETNK
jgi:cobalt-zinc-cadmium efflux system outer membrane protein